MPTFVFIGSLTRAAPNFGEANGRGISTLLFDDQTGQVTPVAEFGGIDDTSWLTLDAKRRRLYAVCEEPGTDESWVASFSIDQTGRLAELNRQPTGGQTACHMSLTPDGRFLAVANYNAVVPSGLPDGAVCVFPIGEDGSLLPAVAKVRHEGTGPNPVRQERSHAHCAVISPEGHNLYVCDLGLDRIVVYALGADGRLTARPSSDLVLPPGTGPRHLAFSADGRRLFMVSELIPTVVSASVDLATGGLKQLDAFSIPSLDGGVVQPAGILLTADERHLFVELRMCEELLGLSVDASTGKLSQTDRRPAGGTTPRDFAFSPSGKHLIVANQDADRVSVFAVDHQSGRLSQPVHQLPIGTPMAIAIADFPA